MKGPLAKPPCETCPKVAPGDPPTPDSGRWADAPAWGDAVRWWLRGRAVGFGPDVPDDLADLAAAVGGWVADREDAHRTAVSLARAGRTRSAPPRLPLPVLNAILHG